MAHSSVLFHHSGSKGQGNQPHAYQLHPHFFRQILSISTAFLPQIANHCLNAEVVGIYKRAINVLVDGALIAFVLPELGNGPFHIAVNELPRFIPGQPLIYCWDGEQLTLGEWAFLSTPMTQHWDPRPQWETLDITLEKGLLLLDSSKQVLEKNAPGNAHTLNDIQLILSVLRLDDFWHSLKSGDPSSILHAAKGLVGRGPGLTPTGDDFLAGFMVSLWALHHPHTQKICSWIVDAAQQCTTHISTAYLEAIAAGYADERWHQFIYAINSHDSQLLFSAISHILAFGATSGSDMLFGFVSGVEFQQ